MSLLTRFFLIVCCVAVLLGIVALISVWPVDAASPTMYSVKTTVVKIVQRADYCTVWVARGANGTVLEDSGPICGLKKGARITINYYTDYRPVCNWLGRNCKQQIVYRYANAYPGW